MGGALFSFYLQVFEQQSKAHMHTHNRRLFTVDRQVEETDHLKQQQQQQQ